MDLIRLRRVVEAARDDRGSTARLTLAVEATDGLSSVLSRHLEIARGRRVPPDRAAGVLGSESVGWLATQAMLGAGLAEAKLPPFLTAALWEDALRTAAAASTLGSALGLDTEEWFGAAAMVMQLATVELFVGRPFAVSYLELVRPESAAQRVIAERELFQRTRADAFDRLAERLGLTEELAGPVRQALSGGPAEQQATLLRFGENLAWRVAHASGEDARLEWCAQAGLALGLSDGDMHRVSHDALVSSVAMAKILDAPIPGIPQGWSGASLAGDEQDPGAIRQHALVLERELSAVRMQLELGRDLCQTTGLPSPRMLRKELANRAVIARATRRDLWLAVVELDDFVDLGAAVGLDATDRVLAAVGQALKGLNAANFVGRIGERGFCVLFEADLRGARVATERLRAVVADVRVSGLTHRVTATILVGNLFSLDRTADPERLIHSIRMGTRDQDRRIRNQIVWLEQLGGIA